MAIDLVEVEDLTHHVLTRTVLSPMLWKKFTIKSPTLTWKQVKYSPNNTSKIPAKRGIYAFLIRNQLTRAAWPRHGYLMYVGIAGRRKSNRTLRERFSEYLTPSELSKRPKVSRLVRTWGDHLYFNYAVVSKKVRSAAELRPSQVFRRTGSWRTSSRWTGSRPRCRSMGATLLVPSGPVGRQSYHFLAPRRALLWRRSIKLIFGRWLAARL